MLPTREAFGVWVTSITLQLLQCRSCRGIGRLRADGRSLTKLPARCRSRCMAGTRQSPGANPRMSSREKYGVLFLSCHWLRTGPGLLFGFGSAHAFGRG